MSNIQLSDHFWLSEFTVSQRATRLGINNQPPKVILDNLIHSASQMEIVRTLLGNHPITPSSVYRSPELNEKTPGSSSTSAHMTGFAVDFACPRFGTPRDIYEYLSMCDEISFDQLILEFDAWVHISFDSQNRNEVFTIGCDIHA